MDIQTNHIAKVQNMIELVLKGRLDIRSSQVVKTALHTTIDTEIEQIIVNFERVDFIDSAGLSAIVSGLRVARERRKDIVLVGLTEQTSYVFDLTMLNRIFTIYSTTDEAIASV